MAKIIQNAEKTTTSESIFSKISTFAIKKNNQIQTTYFKSEKYIIAGMINIKNIIFDFGGVIHDIRYENIADAFVKHGVTDLGDFYSKDSQTHEMDLFEKGLITPMQFRDYVRTATGKALSDDTVDEIINAILIDVPSERIALLKNLRKHYHVYLFSNTNQINYDCFTVKLKKKFGFDIFSECFDYAYFSHMMHCRKPDPDGFRMITEQQHLYPSETVFIDDIAKNLNGAREVGIHGIHLDKGSICDLFDDNGLFTSNALATLE